MKPQEYRSGGFVQVFLWFAIILLSFASVPAARAQASKGAITGRVVDPAGAVVQGALVKLTPGGASTATNNQGEFTLTDVAAGEYTLTISYVGFATYAKQVTAVAGQVIRADSALNVAGTTQQVVVSGEVGGADEAVNVQRASEDISNVITADQITALPNANIADAVGRLPGVTLERDEGEGKYVQIRGTEPRLSNVTVDGIELPSPEASVRQIKLDAIPSELVESIVVDKTLSANQDADAIGGTVNLKLKSAADQPTFIVEGMNGYTPIDNGRFVNQAGVTLGQRFGSNKKFGALLGLTYDYNGRGIDDIEPALDFGYSTPYYDSMDIRQYRYDRTRYGLGGGLDYRLGEASGLYLHYFFSDFEDYGEKWVYTMNDGASGQNGGAPQFSTSNRQPNYRIATVDLGGSHVFTNSWFKWETSMSYGGQLAAAGNPGVDFQYNGPTTDASGNPLCSFDQAATTNPNYPQWSPACTQKGTPFYNPANWTILDLDTTYGVTAQINVQASAAMGRNYSFGGHSGTLEFGARIRNAHKYQNAFSPVYDTSDYTNNNLPLPNLPTMSQFLSGYKNNNYYGDHYLVGPVTRYGSIMNWFLANPNLLPEDEDQTVFGSAPTNYNLMERVSAGYVMNTLRFGRFELQTGLRVEGTQLSILGYLVTQNATQTYATSSSTLSNSWYWDPLPSVQLKYALDADSDVRAVYGRGISRPQPYDMVPYIQLDESSNPYTYSLGNPNLKPEHANDYDLLYEHYLKPYGVVQGGFFYKQLSDPIYYINNPDEQSGPYAGYQVSQIINGSNASLWGIELAYIQHMSFLPGFLNGLTMVANYTHTGSTANGIPLRSDTPALQRQAPNSFNLMPTYQHGRLSLALGLSYNQAMIYQYQYTNENPNGTPASPQPINGVQGPSGDQYLYSHLQLDAQGDFRIRNGLTMWISGLNLTNEVFGFYNGSPIYLDQREFYKPTYSIGMRWEPRLER